MFIAVLLILFAGETSPEVMQKSMSPFVTRAACEEYAAQESRRIEHMIETVAESGRPQKWEMRCVPATPERGA